MAKAANQESEQVVSSGVAPATPFDIIKSVFSSYFGEERVDAKKVNADRLKVWIHFPQITITNSYNRKHIIKDLYVEYLFNSKNGRLIEGPRYMRATISNLEYQTDYVHSHCSAHFRDYMSVSNSIPREIRDCRYYAFGVCTGSGPINNTIYCLVGMVDFSTTNRITYSNPFYKTLLTTLCLETDRIVRWESVEGGPYRLISNIKYTSQSNTSERYEVRLQSNTKGILSIIHYQSSHQPRVTYYHMYELAKQILISVHKKGGATCTVIQKDADNYVINPTLDPKLLELEAIRVIKDTGNPYLIGSLLGEIAPPGEVLMGNRVAAPTYNPSLNKVIQTLNTTTINSGFTKVTQVKIDGFTFKGNPVMMTIYPVSEGRAAVQPTGTSEILYDDLVVYPLFLDYVRNIAPFIYSYYKQ